MAQVAGVLRDAAVGRLSRRTVCLKSAAEAVQTEVYRAAAEAGEAVVYADQFGPLTVMVPWVEYLRLLHAAGGG